MFVRNCPSCGGARQYKRQDLLERAMTMNRPCMRCAVKASHARSPNRFVGENNPMYGKSAYGDMSEDQKAAYRAGCAERSTGKKNPMYGKPSPIGSGRGISGRYKGLHFRSLLELAFIITFEEETQTLPRSAEANEFRLPLTNGSYFPDFTDGVRIFEVKPKRLLNWGQNPEKFAVGRGAFGDKYIVITEDLLPCYHSLAKRLDKIEGLVLHKSERKRSQASRDS